MAKGSSTAFENAIHMIFVLVGIICLFVAASFFEPDNSFWRPVFINLGSSFIVVTIIFAVPTALQDEDYVDIRDSKAKSELEEVVEQSRRRSQDRPGGK